MGENACEFMRLKWIVETYKYFSRNWSKWSFQLSRLLYFGYLTNILLSLELLRPNDQFKINQWPRVFYIAFLIISFNLWFLIDYYLWYLLKAFYFNINKKVCIGFLNKFVFSFQNHLMFFFPTISKWLKRWPLFSRNPEQHSFHSVTKHWKLKLYDFICVLNHFPFKNRYVIEFCKFCYLI